MAQTYFNIKKNNRPDTRLKKANYESSLVANKLKNLVKLF